MLTVKLVYKLSDVPDDLKWATSIHYDTIYTHFQGIINNIYGFGRPFFAPSFFTRPPIFLHVHIRFTRPNDGWTGLYTKLHRMYSSRTRCRAYIIFQVVKNVPIDVSAYAQ